MGPFGPSLMSMKPRSLRTRIHNGLTRYRCSPRSPIMRCSICAPGAPGVKEGTQGAFPIPEYLSVTPDGGNRRRGHGPDRTKTVLEELGTSSPEVYL